MRDPAPALRKSMALVLLLVALWALAGAAQTQEVKREIPNIASEAAKATVLAVASDKASKEIR